MNVSDLSAKYLNDEPIIFRGLTYWAEDEAAQAGSSVAAAEVPGWVADSLMGRPTGFWLASLGGWTAGHVLVAFTRSFLCVGLALRSSARIHDAVLDRALRAPLLFFQRNPTGRILNNYSSDLHRADLYLPARAFQLLDNTFLIVGAFAVAVGSIPWLLLTLPLVVFGYWRVTSLYRATSRELMRPVEILRNTVFADRARCVAQLRARNFILAQCSAIS